MIYFCWVHQNKIKCLNAKKFSETWRFADTVISIVDTERKYQMKIMTKFAFVFSRESIFLE